MVKCVDCKHQHSSIIKEPCRSCIVTDDKPGFELRPPDVITNGDIIRKMSDEELAEYFSNISHKKQLNEWLEWLKEEYIE